MNNISIAYFHDRRDNVPAVAEITWTEVADGLRLDMRATQCTLATCKRSECEHKNGPSWSPVKYAQGTTRDIKNVLSVHALVLDFDHVPNASDLDAHLAKVSRYRRVVHSSHSDKPGDRCLRIVLDLSEPVPAEDWPRFWAAAIAKLGVAEPADPVCRDSSRLYYLPSRPSDATSPAADGTGYLFESHDGKALDVAEILRSAPPVVWNAPIDPVPMPDFKSAPAAEVLGSVAEMLGHAWPDKKRHVAHRALSGWLTRQGWPAELIADLCAAVAEVETPGNGNYPKRLKAATDSLRQLEDGRSVSGLPTLVSLLRPINVSDDGSFVEPGAGRLVPPSQVVSEIQTLLGLGSSLERDDAFWKGVIAAALAGTWAGELADALAEIKTRLAAGDGSDHVPDRLFGMTARELLNTRFPPSVWLVHGLITEGGNAVISTEPKSGKTWAATELAIAVATGTRAFGEFATGAPRRAAYFYAEDYGQQVQSRIRALLAGRGVAEPPDTLHLQPRGKFLDVTRDTDLALIVASCRKLGKLDLLVLDPLRDIHSGDEDKSGPMSDVMRRIRLLGEMLGCTVLSVHHVAKQGSESAKRSPGQRMRGSSAIHGSIDSGLYFNDLRGDGVTEFTNHVRSEVKGARSAGAFDLTLTIRDGAGATAELATWRVDRTESGKLGKSGKGAPDDDEDDRRVLAKVRELASAGHEPLSKSALREVVPGVPDLRARAAIKRLVGTKLMLGTAYTTAGRELRDRVLLVGLGRVGG